MNKTLTFAIPTNTARRIDLNREFNPRITQYNKDVTNKINPITGQNYLENFRGVQKTRIYLGMGQIGKNWDGGEIYPSLSDYLHLQTVLGTMDNSKDLCVERENFEYLVKNIGNLEMELNSINDSISLDLALDILVQKSISEDIRDPFENQFQ
jgi:hypothetical protein